MTMAEYRRQVDTHRRNQILLRATRAAAAVDPVTIYKVIRPNDIDLDPATTLAGDVLQMKQQEVKVQRNKPGRKKGVMNRKVEVVSSILEPVPSGSRTRSGRVSRPPRHIQRFYTNATGEGSGSGALSGTGMDMMEGNNGHNNNNNQHRTSEDGTDNNMSGFYCEDDSMEEAPAIKKQKRTIGGERLKCDQCGKTYVNERKLQQHVQVAHEELLMMGGGGDMELQDGGESNSLRIDCFNFLLARLKKVPMKLRGKVFLDEMEMFVKKMHKLVEKLIKRWVDIII